MSFTKRNLKFIIIFLLALGIYFTYNFSFNLSGFLSLEKFDKVEKTDVGNVSCDFVNSNTLIVPVTEPSKVSKLIANNILTLNEESKFVFASVFETDDPDDSSKQTVSFKVSKYYDNHPLLADDFDLIDLDSTLDVGEFLMVYFENPQDVCDHSVKNLNRMVFNKSGWHLGFFNKDYLTRFDFLPNVSTVGFGESSSANFDSTSTDLLMVYLNSQKVNSQVSSIKTAVEELKPVSEDDGSEFDFNSGSAFEKLGEIDEIDKKTDNKLVFDRYVNELLQKETLTIGLTEKLVQDLNRVSINDGDVGRLYNEKLILSFNQLQRFYNILNENLKNYNLNTDNLGWISLLESVSSDENFTEDHKVKIQNYFNLLQDVYVFYAELNEELLNSLSELKITADSDVTNYTVRINRLGDNIKNYDVDDAVSNIKDRFNKMKFVISFATSIKDNPDRTAAQIENALISFKRQFKEGMKLSHNMVNEFLLVLKIHIPDIRPSRGVNVVSYYYNSEGEMYVYPDNPFIRIQNTNTLPVKIKATYDSELDIQFGGRQISSSASPSGNKVKVIEVSPTQSFDVKLKSKENYLDNLANFDFQLDVLENENPIEIFSKNFNVIGLSAIAINHFDVTNVYFDDNDLNLILKDGQFLPELSAKHSEVFTLAKTLNYNFKDKVDLLDEYLKSIKLDYQCRFLSDFDSQLVDTCPDSNKTLYDLLSNDIYTSNEINSIKFKTQGSFSDGFYIPPRPLNKNFFEEFIIKDTPEFLSKISPSNLKFILEKYPRVYDVNRLLNLNNHIKTLHSSSNGRSQVLELPWPIEIPLGNHDNVKLNVINRPTNITFGINDLDFCEVRIISDTDMQDKQADIYKLHKCSDVALTFK